ncbi:MAG: hypothetical protein LBC86_10250 [Oscillospiraceae bacterium]|nr:hypothetical protein [Oscillospiraceae bacterium]
MLELKYYSATKLMRLTAKPLGSFVAQNVLVSRLPTADNRNKCTILILKSASVLLRINISLEVKKFETKYD